MRHLGILALAAYGALGISVASAIVIGGTNLGLFGYPSHECYRPFNKPIKPYEFTSQWEIDLYNSEVDRYNFEVETFVRCVEKYIANAENDVERIKEKVDEAIRDVKTL
jgi:hypothetical protein